MIGGPRRRASTPSALSSLGRARGIVPVLLLALALVSSGPARALEIGHRQIELVDAARGGRAVLCEVYYPAEVAGEGVALAPGAFPVVSFGHGYLLPWSAYEWFWAALVPEGYVVALPRTEGGLFPSHGAFAGDLALVIAALREAGRDPASPFFGHIGPTAAAMGHSMGGGASLLAAAGDAGIDAVANLAAAETSPSAVAAAAGIAAPALVFAGSHDCVAPPAEHQLAMYGALGSACKTYISVTGGSHCQFAASNSLCSLGEGGCAPPTVTRTAQQETVVRHLLPWLAFVLEGRAAAWADFQAGRNDDPAITSMQSCVAADAVQPPAGGMSLRCLSNPARGTVRVSFRLPRPARLRLELFDALGRRVAVLAEGAAGMAEQVVTWDGRDATGNRVPPGVYRLRLSAGERSESRPLVLVR